MERCCGCCGSSFWGEELTHLWVPTPYTWAPHCYSPQTLQKYTFKCIFFTVTWQKSVFTHLFWSVKNVVPSHFLWLYLHAFHWFSALLLTWNLFCGIEHNWDVGAQGSISAAGVYVSLRCDVSVTLPYLFCVMTPMQCKVSKIRIILFRHLFWCRVKFTFPQVHFLWVHFRNWVSFAGSCYDPTVPCP